MVAAKKTVPQSVVMAAARLAKAAEREGYAGVQAGGNAGQPGHISLYDSMGNQEFYLYEGGSWYLMDESGCAV